MKFDRKLIKRFASFLKGSRKMVMISIITAILSSGIGILLPFLVGRAIDSINEDGVDYGTLTRYIVIMLVLIVISALFQLFMNRTNNKISYNVTEKIRNEAYGKVRKLPVSYIDNTSVGSIQSMVISDCETIGDGLIMFMNQFFAGITAIIFTLVIMLVADWKLALFVLVFTPVSFLVSYFIASRSFSSFKAQSEIRSRQTSFISEGTGNFRIIHLFNINEMICNDFDKINEDYKRTSRKATFLSSITNPSTRFVNSLIYAGVAFIGAGHVTSGAITVGLLASMLAYASQFMKPFNDLSSVYTELSDSMACLTRIFKFLDEAELDDDLTSENVDEDLTWDREGDFEIEFKDVSFRYPDGDEYVLENFNLKVPKGTNVAIVGETGAGKSTLVNLVCRFFKPTKGRILIDGRDAAERSLLWLHSNLGYVLQTPHLFSGSVRENLRYGKADATDEEIMEALRLVSAEDIVKKMEKGLDSDVGEDGGMLSTGEKQLLSFARAILADPKILILDEATSSIDTVTERAIQDAIVTVTKGRTSFVIAHRLSTIVDADIILVVRDGKITERGKHKELMAQKGYYYDLFTRQFDERSFSLI